MNVLAVTCPADLESLKRILGHTRWLLNNAAGMADAISILEHHPGVVLITDAILPDGNWKDLLAHTSRLTTPTPLIVAAHHADDQLWMEVLNSGGYNLVGKPFQEQEVFRVISMAWLHGRSRARTGSAGKG